ncbi:MAG: formate dehydrogenase subunit alpha, partial [Rhodospirillaceae bacterium]|nr:formate dehydrogenase subunit alpha [Rhodospirillaceae bacterium]
DGNCRLCLVEIDGEKNLAASCLRTPSAGMRVSTESPRASTSRNMVMELLITDQPDRDDSPTRLAEMAEKMGVTESRFPARDGTDAPAPDDSHPAIRVNLDACIHCTNCVQACNEVQVNDVIGMAGRGAATRIVFDMNDALALSTCVGCGECVQSCPTGALLTKAAPDVEIDRQVVSLCPYCGVGCQMTYSVANERIISVDGADGPANLSRLCVKGRFGFDYIEHPHRLTVPLVRRDDAPKNARQEFDPGNPLKLFREATWDEALDRAAAGLKSIRDTHGGKALAGLGSAKGSNEEAYLVQKLVRSGFGTNNVDHCTRLCHASSVAALMEGIGSGAVSAPFTAALDADVIIVIGARPAQNHPVAATFIKNAKRSGAKLIVIDPRRQALSRHADEMLQFRPGTDTALLNAMINVIISEDLTDDDYIAAHTEGFDALKAHVAAFPPERMAGICGIDSETIRRVARMYANAPRSLIFWGMGIAQHIHGTDNARCLIALALITGQIGRDGTGLHPLRGQNNVQGASDVGLIPMVYPNYAPVTDVATHKKFEEFWGTPLDTEDGLTVVEMMAAARERDILGMYIMGENPAMSDPDTRKTRDALAALDHLVVQDIFLTETAHFADVVLPASAFAEKTGTFTNSNRQVQLARQVIEPPGEARQDWWIIEQLAGRIGLDWDYNGAENIYAEMHQVMPSIKGIPWSRLEREGCVTYPCSDETQPGKAVLFADGFPTANGRGKLVPTDILEPHELPDDEYPMILITGRMLEHWHTGAISRRAQTLNTLEPEPVASLNPKELDKQGLMPGDTIHVSSRRGQLRIACRADRDVPQGMVFIPFCFTEAPANMLTSPELDPFGKIPEFKFSAVRIEKN